MQYCRDCNIPMTGVMSFSKDKHERFCKFTKCFGETRHRLLRESELEFEEILHKEMKKLNSGSHPSGRQTQRVNHNRKLGQA